MKKPVAFNYEDYVKSQAELDLVKAQLAAAVEDLSNSNCDLTCKHGRWNNNDCTAHKEATDRCGNCFEWRGKVEE